MKVMHVCETLPGGPAAYFDEILPDQTNRYGDENIIVVIPQSQHSYISKNFKGIIQTYSRSGRNLKSLISLGYAIWTAVQMHKPNLVHLHSSFAGAVGRIVLSIMRNRPRIIYCAHCWSFDRFILTWKNKLWILIERFLVRWTDLIINISQHEKILLIENGFSENRLILIENGIKDLPAYSRISNLGLTRLSIPLSLLFIGRMDEQKGFDLLVKELQEIDHARVIFTAVGSAVVSKSDVSFSSRVRYVGWVSREKVVDYLSEADAIVMPSRWEGMPLAAIEALRMGVPIFASDRGPFPYIIKEGVNGILMDINEDGFLRRAIEKFEKCDFGAMKTAARSTYVNRFKSDRLCQELALAYESLFLDYTYEQHRDLTRLRAAIN